MASLGHWGNPNDRDSRASGLAASVTELNTGTVPT